MSLEAFQSSQPLTLGVELELQLVSLSDFDLTHASSNRGEAVGNREPEVVMAMRAECRAVGVRHAPHDVREEFGDLIGEALGDDVVAAIQAAPQTAEADVIGDDANEESGTAFEAPPAQDDAADAGEELESSGDQQQQHQE